MTTSPLRILSMDTSTSAGSLVLSCADQILGELNLDVTETHSVRLLPSIDFLLTHAGISLQELDALAVITGPGSFTGLRIGLATAQALASSVGKPLIPLTSFEAWAARFPCDGGALVPMIDARRNEVYAAVFEASEGRWRLRHAGLVDKPEPVLDHLPYAGITFVGDGAQRYRDIIESRQQPGWRVQASDNFLGRAMARLAYEKALAGEATTAQELKAFYLRKSDAELFWKEK